VGLYRGGPDACKLSSTRRRGAVLASARARAYLDRPLSRPGRLRDDRYV